MEAYVMQMYKGCVGQAYDQETRNGVDSVSWAKALSVLLHLLGILFSLCIMKYQYLTLLSQLADTRYPTNNRKVETSNALMHSNECPLRLIGMGGKRPAASGRGEFTAGVDHGVANCSGKGRQRQKPSPSGHRCFIRIFQDFFILLSQLVVYLPLHGRKFAKGKLAKKSKTPTWQGLPLPTLPTILSSLMAILSSFFSAYKFHFMQILFWFLRLDGIIGEGAAATQVEEFTAGVEASMDICSGKLGRQPQAAEKAARIHGKGASSRAESRIGQKLIDFESHGLHLANFTYHSTIKSLPAANSPKSEKCLRGIVCLYQLYLPLRPV
ncbi:hypothetical protein LXL04_024433 [Taraxacum kok-saghyz]